MLEKLKEELAVLEAAAEKDVVAIEAKAKEIVEWVEKEVEGEPKAAEAPAENAAGAEAAGAETNNEGAKQ